MVWCLFISKWSDRRKERVRQNGLEIVDTKVTKTYGIILFKDAEGTYDIDSFIFRDEMYKPIYFLNDSPAYFKKIPKNGWNSLSVIKKKWLSNN